VNSIPFDDYKGCGEAEKRHMSKYGGSKNLGSLHAPAMIVGALNTHRLRALRSMDRLAVSAMLYRIKNGAFPKTAAAVVPEFLNEVPRDPFDGKPLRYLFKDGTVTIYSIGHNRIDEQGVFSKDNKQDIVITFGGPVPAKPPVRAKKDSGNDY
jgi:hypothetical protein